MKKTNKLSSFIGGVVIAFAIALFVPTAAQATWGNYSNSNYSSSSNYSNTAATKYKRLAYQNLRYYYYCYNYRYYRAYVYYMKKYKQACQSKSTPVNNCIKYKNIADKYLAAYNRCGYYCYYQYYRYYMNAYKKCQVNLKKAGKVCGLVFEDKNKNGTQDAGEPTYKGAKVTITDVNGKKVTVTTDINGKYCQDGIEEGSATVTVDSTSLPANATISTENPTTINVIANKANNAGKDGFAIPDPVGNLCGFVYIEDENAMKNPQENVTVNVMDALGQSQNIKTDVNGKWCVKDIAAGTATADVDETTLPANAEYSSGNGDSSEHKVLANEDNDAGEDVYVIPTQLGNVCGQVIVDNNAQEGVTLNITDANGDITPVKTNTDGKWCANNVVIGDVTVDVDENTLPDGVERVLGQDNDTYTVEAGKTANALIDGYKTQGNCVCFRVYEDKNGNGKFDNGEGIGKITATLTDVNGVKHTSETYVVDGDVYFKNIPLGPVTITVDDNDADMPTNLSRTIGQNDITFNVTHSGQNKAPYHGFTQKTAPSTAGCVCFRVYEDKNGNGKFDNGEGIGKITATLTDVNGVKHTSETYVVDGDVYFKNIPFGSVTITVDDSDADMPAHLIRTIGANSVIFDVTDAGQNKAPYHGFTDPNATPVVAPVNP